MKSHEIFGTIGDTTLIDVCTLLQTRVGCLQIENARRIGRVFFDEGNVVHAFVEDMQGMEAFEEIFMWRSGVFSFQKGVQPPSRTLGAVAMPNLLMSTTLYCDLVDELSRAGFGSSSILSRAEGFAASDMVAEHLVARLWELLASPQRAGDLMRIVRGEGHPKGNIMRALSELYRAGYLGIIKGEESDAIPAAIPSLPGIDTSSSLPLAGQSFRTQAAEWKPNVHTIPTMALPVAPAKRSSTPWIAGAVVGCVALGVGVMIWMAASRKGEVVAATPVPIPVASVPALRPPEAPAPAIGFVPVAAPERKGVEVPPVVESPPAISVPDMLDPADVRLMMSKVGQKIQIRGKIVKAGLSKTGTTRFFNFTDNIETDFYLVLFGTDLMKFSANGDPKEALIGKMVEVTGTVEEHKGRPQIRLTDPGQLRILEP